MAEPEEESPSNVRHLHREVQGMMNELVKENIELKKKLKRYEYAVDMASAILAPFYDAFMACDYAVHGGDEAPDLVTGIDDYEE